MGKIFTFMAGCGAGIFAGLILAPSSGQELRGNLSNKVQEGVDKLSGKVNEGRRFVQEQGGVRGVVEKGFDRGRNVATVGLHRVSESIQQGKNKLNESIESGKNRINEAIDAGKTEYQQQRTRDVSGI
jgi:gas vesicle protein